MCIMGYFTGIFFGVAHTEIERNINVLHKYCVGWTVPHPKIRAHKLLKRFLWITIDPPMDIREASHSHWS